MNQASLSRLAFAVALLATRVALADAPAAEAPAAAPAADTTSSEPTLSDLSSHTIASRWTHFGLGAPGGAGFALSDDGRTRLHLGLDAGVGFDTNPYAVPNSENVFAGDVLTRIRPSTYVIYQGSTIAFRGEAFLDYGFLPDALGSSAPSYLLYQSAASADLEINRSGLFSFALGDTLRWDSDPGEITLGSVFNRANNSLRAGVGMRPGGGTLFFRLGYQFDFTKWFDVGGRNGPIGRGDFDTMSHSLNLRADYRFLPRTGVFLNATAGWTSYPFSTANPTGFPVSVSAGLQGQILPKLSGLASVGYSNPLIFQNNKIQTSNLIGVVAQLEARWQLLPTATLAGGFIRNFAPAPVYQFLGSNRIYAQYQQTLAGRFILGVNGGATFYQFGVEQQLSGSPLLTDHAAGDRVDANIDADASLSYAFLDWLSLGIANNLDWRLTNANDAALGQNLSYFRNETLLVLSVRY